jgi:hypothetical protein
MQFQFMVAMDDFAREKALHAIVCAVYHSDVIAAGSHTLGYVGVYPTTVG